MKVGGYDHIVGITGDYICNPLRFYMVGSRHFALDYITTATANDGMAVISEMEATWDVKWTSMDQFKIMGS